MHEPAITDKDPDMVDFVGRSPEEDQVAVFQLVPANYVPHTVLLARGARDVDTAQVIDGPDKTAAVHAVYHRIATPTVRNAYETLGGPGGDATHVAPVAFCYLLFALLGNNGRLGNGRRRRLLQRRFTNGGAPLRLRGGDEVRRDDPVLDQLLRYLPGILAPLEIAETDGIDAVFLLEVEGLDPFFLQLPGQTFGVIHIREGADLDGETYALEAGTLGGASGGNRCQEQQADGEQSYIFEH